MPDILSMIPNWLLGGFGAGGGFAIFKWGAEAIFGRLDKRAAALDAGTQRLMDGMEKRLDAVSRRLDVVERELAECTLKHAKAEAEVMRLTAMMQGYGDARDKVQTEVAAVKLAGRGIK